jgi:flavin reductase (DIM6/NTAB) family NADH-FMN oxidoreductase RutF
MDSSAIDSVFAQLDPTIWLVTAASGSRRGGLIATFVNQASIVPSMPRVLVGLAKQHHTWELIQESGSFGLHLLAEQQLDWVWRFGLVSGRDQDKLAGMKLEARTGPPLLAEAVAWLDCRVEASLDTGDRTVFLAEVLEGRLLSSAPALTVQRMLQLAPAEKLQELKHSVTRDATADSAAIQMWRSLRNEPRP